MRFPGALRKIFFIAVVGGVLLLPVAFGLFLFFAIQPGISPDKIPSAAILDYQISSTPSPSTSPQRIKVATYNVGYASGNKNNLGDVLSREEVEKNLQQLAEALQKIDADIVFLQEIDFFSRRTFGINQWEFLAEKLKMPYGAYVLTWNKQYVAWPYWPPARHFGRLVSGQGVLSRFPIREQTLKTFPKPEKNPFWYNWFYMDRMVQTLKIQIGAEWLSIYNIHLEPFVEEARRLQFQKLAEIILEDSTPRKIVAGDFNEIWHGKGFSPEQIQAAQNTFRNFEKSTGLKMAAQENNFLTFPTWEPKEGIDHIYYSPPLKLSEAGIASDIGASDHIPVWAVFENPLKWAISGSSLPPP